MPQAAPSGLRADALNSTAVQVRWRPPDPQLVNGLNQGYRVEAWPRGSAVGVGSPEASLVVAPLGGAPLQEHAAVVAGLRKYHSYNLTVLCFTSPGNGPRSAPVLVTTKQDGEAFLKACGGQCWLFVVFFKYFFVCYSLLLQQYLLRAFPTAGNDVHC